MHETFSCSVLQLTDSSVPNLFQKVLHAGTWTPPGRLLLDRTEAGGVGCGCQPAAVTLLGLQGCEETVKVDLCEGGLESFYMFL